jgi:NTP pyrophosphatase (non-canonical NTP hydrolase)
MAVNASECWCAKDREVLPSDLPLADVLLQTAEECGELTQAATKALRKIRNINPTPKTLPECLEGVMEELIDVKVTISVLEDVLGLPHDFVNDGMNLKYERWIDRLNDN